MHTINQQVDQAVIEGLINVPIELLESSRILKDRTSNALLSQGAAIRNSDKSSRKKWTRRTGKENAGTEYRARITIELNATGKKRQ